jgi:predicted  nucleic acid-binding Zn-ribbon protein
MAEGKHQQIVEEMKHDLDRCHEKLRTFETRLNASDVNVGEMKADIRHILESTARIEGKLDEHIAKGSDA